MSHRQVCKKRSALAAAPAFPGQRNLLTVSPKCTVPFLLHVCKLAGEMLVLYKLGHSVYFLFVLSVSWPLKIELWPFLMAPACFILSYSFIFWDGLTVALLSCLVLSVTSQITEIRPLQFTHLPSAGVKGLNHHTQLLSFFKILNLKNVFRMLQTHCVVSFLDGLQNSYLQLNLTKKMCWGRSRAGRV